MIMRQNNNIELLRKEGDWWWWRMRAGMDLKRFWWYGKHQARGDLGLQMNYAFVSVSSLPNSDCVMNVERANPVNTHMHTYILVATYWFGHPRCLVRAIFFFRSRSYFQPPIHIKKVRNIFRWWVFRYSKLMKRYILVLVKCRWRALRLTLCKSCHRHSMKHLWWINACLPKLMPSSFASMRLHVKANGISV